MTTGQIEVLYPPTGPQHAGPVIPPGGGGPLQINEEADGGLPVNVIMRALSRPEVGLTIQDMTSCDVSFGTRGDPTKVEQYTVGGKQYARIPAIYQIRAGGRENRVDHKIYGKVAGDFFRKIGQLLVTPHTRKLPHQPSLDRNVAK